MCIRDSDNAAVIVQQHTRLDHHMPISPTLKNTACVTIRVEDVLRHVKAWQSTAEMICKHFAKGKEIVVEGKLSSREYEDNSGNKRTCLLYTSRCV